MILYIGISVIKVVYIFYIDYMYTLIQRWQTFTANILQSVLKTYAVGSR